jgi:hypothetical protein
MVRWVDSLIARLKLLTPGRYAIILTIGRNWVDWSIQKLGKIESVRVDKPEQKE